MKYTRYFALLVCVLGVAASAYYCLTTAPESRYHNPVAEIKLPFGWKGYVLGDILELTRWKCTLCRASEGCSLLGIASMDEGSALGNPSDTVHWSHFTYGHFQVFSLTLPLWMVMVMFCPYPIYWAFRVLARPWWRSLRHQCIHCAYNLTGNESGVCPECGTAFVQKPPIQDRMKTG